MSKAQPIAWTAPATLISGALLFILSQVIADLFLKPLIRFRELLADLHFEVIFRSDYPCSSSFQDAPEKHREISARLRELSARLTSLVLLVPFYWFFALARICPEQAECETGGKFADSTIEPERRFFEAYAYLRRPRTDWSPAGIRFWKGQKKERLTSVSVLRRFAAPTSGKSAFNRVLDCGVYHT